MGLLDLLKKKKSKRPAPYGIMNKEIVCTGVSLDDLSNLDLKTIKKTVKKNIDHCIKNLHKLSDKDLKDKREETKRERTPRNQLASQYRSLWAVEKQKVVLSELDRLIEATDKEIKIRMEKS